MHSDQKQQQNFCNTTTTVTNSNCKDCRSQNVSQGTDSMLNNMLFLNYLTKSSK